VERQRHHNVGPVAAGSRGQLNRVEQYRLGFGLLEHGPAGYQLVDAEIEQADENQAN
jgi:hypothetical protein